MEIDIAADNVQSFIHTDLHQEFLYRMCVVKSVFWLHFHIQGVFSLPYPPKSVRLHSKSHQKSSKCQNLVTEKNLWFFRGSQLKKTPCIKSSCWKYHFEKIAFGKYMVFFHWYPPKNSKCQPVSKFWHLEHFWWDLLCNLTLLGGTSEKKTSCTSQVPQPSKVRRGTWLGKYRSCTVTEKLSVTVASSSTLMTPLLLKVDQTIMKRWWNVPWENDPPQQIGIQSLPLSRPGPS